MKFNWKLNFEIHGKQVTFQRKRWSGAWSVVAGDKELVKTHWLHDFIYEHSGSFSLDGQQYSFKVKYMMLKSGAYLSIRDKSGNLIGEQAFDLRGNPVTTSYFSARDYNTGAKEFLLGFAAYFGIMLLLVIILKSILNYLAIERLPMLGIILTVLVIYSALAINFLRRLGASTDADKK